MEKQIYFASFIISIRKLALLAFCFLGCVQTAHAQFNYQNKPALQIIVDIEQRTSFHFLYRDALLADLSLSFSADSISLFNKLRTVLRFHRLDLKVDRSRNQAIIFRSQQNTSFQKEVTIRGQVVDAATGERLPFANITWNRGPHITGVSANQSGSFYISRPFTQNTVTLHASYIGYAPSDVTITITNINEIAELTFRLQPKPIEANELIVTGTKSYGTGGQVAAGLVNIGTFSPVGAANSLRALQVLPSVSVSPALSNGLHVRGSPADGFQVLLDGIPIYNQTHLFGLLDSFNGDILQRNSFFYGIAPARFQAPPGGTLSLDTKTGSLRKFSATAGLSNTSARLTLSGPLSRGNSSWLISARKSFMNTVHWLSNDDLVAWGLGVNRTKEVLDKGLTNFKSQLVQPKETDASFYDFHGKLYWEGNSGSRLIASGYFGGDQTKLNAVRLFEAFSITEPQNVDKQPVTTTNDWHNGAFSLQYQQWIGDKLYSKSIAGGSFYQTAFKKDDFSYTRLNTTTQTLQSFIYPFENKSVLNEFKAGQMLALYSNPWVVSAGLFYHYFSNEYYEDSFDQPGYFYSIKAHQLDVYIQLDFTGLEMLNIFGGTRIHYYSNGQYFRWSPRMKAKLFPDARLSVSFGFSRNHQFLNQINLRNTITADVWILASRKQPSAAVNYFTGGLYLDLSYYFYIQAEGYYKDIEHLRLHELNTYSLAGGFNSNPWLTNNSGTAKGLEFFMRNAFGAVTLSQTFTLSEVTLSNPAINGGKPFYADWDRRYQYTVTLGADPTDAFSIYLSWIYATGTPNKLATFGSQNIERLGDYRRADLSVEYRRVIGSATLNLTLTAFNLLDRRNPWYRQQSYVIDQSSTPNRFKSTAVVVYDLGFQPSFNISVSF